MSSHLTKGVIVALPVKLQANQNNARTMQINPAVNPLDYWGEETRHENGFQKSIFKVVGRQNEA